MSSEPEAENKSLAQKDSAAVLIVETVADLHLGAAYQKVEVAQKTVVAAQTKAVDLDLTVAHQRVEVAVQKAWGSLLISDIDEKKLSRYQCTGH